MYCGRNRVFSGLGVEDQCYGNSKGRMSFRLILFNNISLELDTYEREAGVITSLNNIMPSRDFIGKQMSLDCYR